jgi:hypothetical protein
MDNSQYRIAQVHADITPFGDTTDTTTATTTTVDSGAADTTANTTTTDTTVTDDTGADATNTDKPTETNKPIIVLMDNPFSKGEGDKKGIVTPGDMFYYGALTAIIIALLATAYNSVKTANIAGA